MKATRVAINMQRQAFVRAFSSADNPSHTFKLARPFKGHKLTPPVAEVTATRNELMGFYRIMQLYRRFEIVADTLYKERLIRGFCHLYDGQEAVVVGLEAAIKPTDSVITAYREHCHQLARGDTPRRAMAELLGKFTGCSKGKGGSMHMYNVEKNFYGGNGIVGAQVPVGAGLAFKHKYLKDGGIAIAAMGDGAANQGQVYEAANMAALWKLPFIFQIENNEFGMGTSTRRASASTDFYTRGDYVPGLWIDGMDVLAVKAGFQFAAEWCRSGKGPLFLETQTYRYHGHSMSDPGVSYRSRQDIDTVRAERDCIENVKNRLLSLKWATESELKKIDKEVRAEVDDAADFARKSPFPPAEQLTADIYAGAPPPHIRLVDHAKSIINH